MSDQSFATTAASIGRRDFARARLAEALIDQLRNAGRHVWINKRGECRFRVVSRARGRIFASRSANASLIASPCFVTQIPEALIHERPPLSAMDRTITSRYFSQSSMQSSPITILLSARTMNLDARIVIPETGRRGVAENDSSLTLPQDPRHCRRGRSDRN